MERSKKKNRQLDEISSFMDMLLNCFFFSKVHSKTSGIGDFNTIYFWYKLFTLGSRQMVVCKIDLWIYEEKIYCFIFFWAADFYNIN